MNWYLSIQLYILTMIENIVHIKQILLWILDQKQNWC